MSDHDLALAARRVWSRIGLAASIVGLPIIFGVAGYAQITGAA